MTDKTTIRLDTDALDLGDLEDFEDYVGIELSKAIRPKATYDEETGKPILDEQGRPVKEVQLSAKALVGIVWIVARADRPGMTVADARKIKVMQLDIVSPEDEDPKDGADAGAS